MNKPMNKPITCIIHDRMVNNFVSGYAILSRSFFMFFSVIFVIDDFSVDCTDLDNFSVDCVFILLFYSFFRCR